MMCDPINWMTEQLGCRQEPEKKEFKNPQPPGVIRPGSGTDVLLRYLKQQPGRWFFHAELVLSLGRSKGEVDWALQYLAAQNLLESRETELIGRKPVLRYRLR